MWFLPWFDSKVHRSQSIEMPWKSTLISSREIFCSILRIDLSCDSINHDEIHWNWTGWVCTFFLNETVDWHMTFVLRSMAINVAFNHVRFFFSFKNKHFRVSTWGLIPIIWVNGFNYIRFTFDCHKIWTCPLGINARVFISFFKRFHFSLVQLANKKKKSVDNWNYVIRACNCKTYT